MSNAIDQNLDNVGTPCQTHFASGPHPPPPNVDERSDSEDNPDCKYDRQNYNRIYDSNYDFWPFTEAQ